MNIRVIWRRRVNGRTWARMGVALALGALMVSCKIGPDYKRPTLDMLMAYKSATDQEAAQPGLDLDWWKLFQDPDLSALAEEALKANQGMKAAMARVAEARAAAASVEGQFFSVVTMNPSAIRSRKPAPNTPTNSTATNLSQAASFAKGVSKQVGQVGALSQGSTTGNSSQTTTQTSSTTPSATTSNLFQISFDLSYEIDFWGRVRRSYEAARAQTQVSVYDFEVVRQTLLADVAQNYFNLRSLDAQDEILTRNVALYREEIDLTAQQLKAGIVNETNILQAKVQYESTRAQEMDIHRQHADLEHAIAILLGKAPVEFSLNVRPLDATPPVIPAGLPANVLKRRPDVAEAERNLAVASAQIGVAKANFFPVVKLTGAAGFESTDIQHALDWRNRIWSLGPSVALPIFEGGQLRANLRQAKARYDEMQATYRNAVLGAFTDVENSLTDLHMRADEADAQEKAVTAAREYQQLTQVQYRNGLVNYLQVIDAKRRCHGSQTDDPDYECR